MIDTEKLRAVLEEVAVERAAQNARFGEQNFRILPAAAQSTRAVGLLYTAHGYREVLRHAIACGSPTFALILLEEVAEALEAARDGDMLAARAELVQVAAVAVQMIEALDRG